MPSGSAKPPRRQPTRTLDVRPAELAGRRAGAGTASATPVPRSHQLSEPPSPPFPPEKWRPLPPEPEPIVVCVRLGRATHSARPPGLLHAPLITYLFHREDLAFASANRARGCRARRRSPRAPIATRPGGQSRLAARSTRRIGVRFRRPETIEVMRERWRRPMPPLPPLPFAEAGQRRFPLRRHFRQSLCPYSGAL